MIASLPMYDRAETAGANDRLWHGIRDRLHAAGIDAPRDLSRGILDLWTDWTSPDLVFSQTCGFPYRARLHGKVSLIGTPDFGVDGCPPGFYRSVFVARTKDARAGLADFAGAPFAYNEAMSQSGWAAVQNHLGPLGLSLGPTLCTGGHLFSALAVAEGRADLAAVDAVTWRMLTRWEPFTQRLRVVAETEPTPGLPYISAKGFDPKLLFGVVSAAIAELGDQERDILGLRGLVAIPEADYLAVPIPPPPEQIVHSG